MNNEIFSEYPDVVSIQNITKMLHIGRNMAYELLRSGKIKSVRCGDRYIVPKKCVIEFLETAS